jgi:hypothetical protein
MRCRLPVAIRVETAEPCDNLGVIVRLPPLCAAFTTSEASAILEHLNEGPNPLEVDSVIGASPTCEAIDAGNVADITLAANLAFFDSTIGDILSQLSLSCE